jgi:hypothetical protein
MSWGQTRINQIARAYGYKQRSNQIADLCVGDEVIITDTNGNPCIQDLVECVDSEAVKVGGQWWYNFEYSIRKI